MDNEDKYDLYTENIVTKPWTKYKKVIGFFLFLLAAVMFGVIVTLVVTYLYPMINEKPKETHKIVIEKDSFPYEKPDKESQGAEKPSQEAVKDVKEVATDIKKSLVLIQIAKDGESGQEELFQSVPGIIIEMDDSDDTEYGFYILTKYSYLDKAGKMAVRFNDGTVCSANFLGYHSATNTAIIYARTSDSQGINMAEVDDCALGSSYSVVAGEDILVMGKIQGNVEAFSSGRCTSNSALKNLVDMNLGVIATDVANKSGDDSYLFDRQGRLIGVGIDSSAEIINAYGISDLKNVIEVLINGKTMPCFGINGTTVTEEIQMAYELPLGVYVSKIIIDSPAFKGGLQTGDVIVQVNNNEVKTMNDFTTGIFALSISDRIEITVMRKGSEGYRRVELSIYLDALASVLGQ